MSGYDDNDLGALNRLEDLLDAYMALRLVPRGPVLSRIRAAVLTEHAAMAATAATSSRAYVPAPASRSRFQHWTLSSPFVSRALALGFAATLTVGTTAAVMGAPAGSAFYNARVYLETLVLPSQLDARVAAHERLLDERLADAELAAAHGDTAGLAAALDAYQAEVDAASADVGTDKARLAHLEDVLSKHTAVLTALAERLPEQSSIENAIETSSKAIDKLRATADDHPAHPTHPPGGPERPDEPRGNGAGGSQNQGGHLGQDGSEGGP